MQVTLCDLIQDVMQNACESGAGTVELEISEVGNEFRFLVKDNGKGMSPSEAQSAVHAFDSGPGAEGGAGAEAVPPAEGVLQARRKAGIGIPFLINTVNDASGCWDLHTEKGQGTTFTVWFDMDNVETPPIGDMSVILRSVLLFSGPDEIIIKRLRRTGRNDVRYEIRKSEITQSLGGLADPASQTLLGAYLKALEAEPGNGAGE